MNARFFALFLALLFLPLSALAQKAPAAKPFQKIEKCTLKADRWNDGDSFHVLTGSEPPEIVARLYSVDTPEAETAYRDRLDKQGAYFGISREQAVDLAHEAAAFTAKRLSKPLPSGLAGAPPWGNLRSEGCIASFSPIPARIWASCSLRTGLPEFTGRIRRSMTGGTRGNTWRTLRNSKPKPRRQK